MPPVLAAGPDRHRTVGGVHDAFDGDRPRLAYCVQVGQRYGPCVAADDDARVTATSPGGRGRGRWWLQAVEASPDGVLIVEGGTIVYANRAMEDLAGTRGPLTGQSVERLVPSAVRPRHRRLRRRFAESGHSRPMGGGVDLTLCRADGSTLPVEVALAPLTVDGRVLTLATVRDVSARRAEQADLARLAHILQIVPDGVIVVDQRTGNIVDVNPAAAAMLGYTTGSMPGSPASRLSATGDPDFLRLASSELSVQRVRTRSGDTLDCEVHAVTFDAPSGTEVVNVVRDVGPRLELERQVRASEESIRVVFDRAPVGLAVTRRDAGGARTIVRTNDAFARMFGFGPHELDGKGPSALRPFREPGRGTMADLPEAEDSLIDRTDVRRYVRPDGSALWAEVRATRLVLEGPDDALVLVHALDVTERVEAERSRRQQNLVTECIADVSNAALAHEDLSKVLDLIARGALAAVEADGAVILRSVTERTTRRVAAATGALAAALSTGLERSAVIRAVAEGAPGDAGRALRSVAPSIGEALAVPFGPDESLPSGRVVVCREPGRPPFSPAEATELDRLASQTQLALHLAQARDAQQRLALVEERQRIARDLHDTVIQDMIAIGMEMSAELSSLSDPQQRTRTVERLDRLEDVVVSLRRAVFQLRDPTGGRSLAREVTDAVAQASRLLPSAPTVTFAGPLELVPAALVDDLVAVLRAALSNVTRHAGATRVGVSLTVTDVEVVLVVDDDGIGLAGSSQSGFGVLSLTERAHRHGGSVSVGPGPDTGTRVTWRCPLLP